MEYPYLFAQTPLYPNQLRAKYTILLFRVVVIITLLTIVLNASILRAYTVNGSVPQIAFTISAIFRLVAAVPPLILGVFFLLWMSRAYKNLAKSEVEAPQFSQGWAAASWFVPFMNFVRPYRIVKEIWNKTQAAFRDGQPYENKKDDLVFYWWMTYIFSGFISGFASFLTTSREWEMGYAFMIIANVVSLFAALYGSKMVRTISVMEEEMLDRTKRKYEEQVSASAQRYIESGSFEEVAPKESLNETEVPPEEFTLIADFTDNSEHKTYLVIGLKLLIIMAFLFCGICFYIATETKSGDFFEVHKAAQKWLGPITWGGFILTCFTGIVLMLWMKRAYTNLYNLNIKDLSFRPDAAIYSWFIPCANVFIPYIILQDINRHMQQAINKERFPVDKQPANHTLIIIMWLLLVMSVIFLYFWSVIPTYAFSGVAGWYGIFSAITGIVAFYLGIVAVKNISALEEQLFARLEEEHRDEEIIEVPKEEEESINPAGTDQNQIPPGNNFN